MAAFAAGNQLSWMCEVRRKIWPVLALVLFFIATSPASAQQVAGTVEDGLAQLAHAIADRSKAAERTTIAVLPFPHADGACSVLSTYVVDELILSLFSLSDAELEIIERSQLEAIITELAIGEGGLLNPATTKELGNLSGVSALAIGTITIIGDSIRLNARLVATDTGKTISAAAVTIPKTQAITSLLGQSSTCAVNVAANSGSAPVSRPAASGNSGVAAQSEFSAEGLHFAVQGLFQSDDKKVTTVRMVVTNVTDDFLNVAWVQPVPTLMDDKGNSQSLAELTGQQHCGGEYSWFSMSAQYCVEIHRNLFTTLSPQIPSIINMRFRRWNNGTGDTALTGEIFSFASNIVRLENDKYSVISVSIPSIRASQ